MGKIDGSGSRKSDMCAHKPDNSNTFLLSLPSLTPSTKMAPSMTILSAAASKKLDARLRELLNDGLSDAQIARIVRREASSEGAIWPVLPVKAIRDRIYELADSESDSDYDPAEDSDASSTTSSSSDSTYVPEETESEGECAWGGDASDSESDATTVSVSDESYESDSSSATSTEDEAPRKKQQIVKTARFFLDNADDTMDRITITPNGDGTFAVEMAYDLTYSYNHPDRASFFEGSASDVYEYILSAIRLLAIDELPYASVEASLPFYPAIRVTPRRLLKKVVRKCIMKALSQYLGHYATA